MSQQVTSVNLSVSPFASSCDSTRLNMAAKQFSQSLTHENCEIPYVVNNEWSNLSYSSSLGIQYAQKPELIDGARKDGDIERYANALASNTADPTTGYMAVPLFYVRSIGRGKYGNYYSMSIARDVDAEKEYDVKMYKFNLTHRYNILWIISKHKYPYIFRFYALLRSICYIHLASKCIYRYIISF